MFSITTLSLDAPSPDNPCEYPKKNLFRQKLGSMADIFAADSMGLSSFIFCSGLRKTYLFCNRMHIGRSRSPKVVDFGTNRKGVCDFLLVIHSNFGPVLHLFLDTASYWLKIANFRYPTLSFNALARGEPFGIFG